VRRCFQGGAFEEILTRCLCGDAEEMLRGGACEEMLTRCSPRGAREEKFTRRCL
jgi:hypothetical protein